MSLHTFCFRTCMVGARKGQFPNILGLIQVQRKTPTPALLFVVSIQLQIIENKLQFNNNNCFISHFLHRKGISKHFQHYPWSLSNFFHFFNYLSNLGCIQVVQQNMHCLAKSIINKECPNLKTLDTLVIVTNQSSHLVYLNICIK